MQQMIAIAIVGMCLGLAIGWPCGSGLGRWELIRELGFKSWAQFFAWKEAQERHMREKAYAEIGCAGYGGNAARKPAPSMANQNVQGQVHKDDPRALVRPREDGGH